MIYRFYSENNEIDSIKLLNFVDTWYSSKLHLRALLHRCLQSYISSIYIFLEVCNCNALQKASCVFCKFFRLTVRYLFKLEFNGRNRNMAESDRSGLYGDWAVVWHCVLSGTESLWKEILKSAWHKISTFEILPRRFHSKSILFSPNVHTVTRHPTTY